MDGLTRAEVASRRRIVRSVADEGASFDSNIFPLAARAQPKVTGRELLLPIENKVRSLMQGIHASSFLCRELFLVSLVKEHQQH